MNAIKRKGQRQIDPVIDEKGGASAVHEREEPLREFKEGPCGEILLAKLDGSRPPLKGGLHHRLEGPTFCLVAVGDNVQTP